jgi:hypothetical protein
VRGRKTSHTEDTLQGTFTLKNLNAIFGKGQGAHFDRYLLVDELPADVELTP